MSDQPGHEDGAPPHERGPVTVLVADDHPLWRDALVAVLVDAGDVVLAVDQALLCGLAEPVQRLRPVARAADAVE